MVPFILTFVLCIGMDEGAQWSSVYDQPRYECSKLRWREDIDLKHRNRMWAYRPLEELIYAKFWN